MKNVVIEAGSKDFCGGPVRFSAEGIPDGVMVLELTSEDGKVKVYAQRDEKEFVIMVPPMKAQEKIVFKTEKATVQPNTVLLKREGDRIDVNINNELFTSFHFGKDLEKPFLYPVRLGEGLLLTRGWPKVEEDLPEKAKDHPHHVSWWVSHGEVNGSNFWHVEKGCDIQELEAITVMQSGPVFGKISARINWNTDEGKRVLREERDYYFYASTDKNRLADMRVNLIASDGDVVFNDTKEGGICSIRMNPAIDEQNGNGKMTNSEGMETEKECWGKPAKWNDYSGNLNGQDVGLAVMDHPSNFRHPTPWHIRGYGLYTANPFGLGAFTNGKENGTYTLANGKNLLFTYRVLAHFGNTQTAGIEPVYQAWVAGPQVSWQP